MSFVCSGLIIVLSFWGLFSQCREQKRMDLWNAYVGNLSLYEDTISELDTNPIKQYEYALDRYREHDYAQARKYFQLAAVAGNGIAYAYLALMELNGLGGPANVHTALEYYKNARRIDEYELVDFEQHPLFDELSDFEKQSLASTDVELKHIQLIHREIIDMMDAQGIDAICTVVGTHEEDLIGLASKGYEEALHMLYLKAFLSMESGSDGAIEKQMHELSVELYKRNDIPTDLYLRWRFFESYYLDDSRRSKDIFSDDYIKDNCYYPNIAGTIDYNELTDDRLIQLYKYLRARLNWLSALINGSIPAVKSYVSGGTSTEDYYAVTHRELQLCIREVQKRINDCQSLWMQLQ